MKSDCTSKSSAQFFNPDVLVLKYMWGFFDILTGCFATYLSCNNHTV